STLLAIKSESAGTAERPCKESYPATPRSNNPQHLVAILLKFVSDPNALRAIAQPRQLSGHRVQMPGRRRAEFQQRENSHFPADPPQLNDRIDMKLQIMLFAV